MKKTNPTRWYARYGSVSNRRAIDIPAHTIFMNASIGRRRRAVVEAWEVRLGERDIGIVWATWGRHFLHWHNADVTLRVGRAFAWEREDAIRELVSKYRQRQNETTRTRPAPELDDFRI